MSIWQVVVPMTLDGDTRVEATVTVHDNMPNTIKVVIDTTLAGGAGKTTRREVVANLVEFAARANYALPEGAFQVSLPELARGNPAQVSYTVALVFRAAALQHLRHLVSWGPWLARSGYLPGEVPSPCVAHSACG